MCRIGNGGAIGIDTSQDLGINNRKWNRGYIEEVDTRRPGSVAGLEMPRGEFDEPSCIAAGAEFVDVGGRGIDL